MWIICKHFPIASEMRPLVVCLFGIHWVMTLRVMDLLSSWQGSFGWHCNAAIWKIVPHCLIRAIGGRGMLEVLRVVSSLSLSLNLFSFYLCWIGLKLVKLSLVILSQIC